MTVAEYVEDESVVDLLKEIGIDYAQGFHWGKPTAEPQLELTHAETAQPESTGWKNNKSARKTTKV